MGDYTLTMADSNNDKGDTVNDTIALDTPAQIAAAQWLSFMHMIALEINTGMKHSRGPVLRLLYRAGLIDAEIRGTKKNKIMVLGMMVENYQSVVPTYTPSASIQRALGGDK